MVNKPDTTVSVASAGATLRDGVMPIRDVPADLQPGCRVFVHYNGPTDQLSTMCTGMVVLDPGASPHPPHRHPEEEFMIVASGSGVIEVDGKPTPVGPGAIMYCGANVFHGITNTGAAPMIFYWSKWIAKGF